jgi:hypothetical protein
MGAVGWSDRPVIRPRTARPGATIGDCAFLRMHLFAATQIKDPLTCPLTFCSFFFVRLCPWTRLKLACSILLRSGLYGPHSGKVCWRRTSPMQIPHASRHGRSNRLQVYCREASQWSLSRRSPVILRERFKLVLRPSPRIRRKRAGSTAIRSH